MKLGILLCDDHYPESIPTYGHYDDAFKRLFQDSAINSYSTFRCFEEEYPNSPDDCDIWLVTGSKWGVYDPDSWIKAVSEFVRRCDEAKRPLLGVCFGHQLIHQALGGRADKSNKGWGMGVYPIESMNRDQGSMSSLPTALNLIACHQDQVQSPAPDFSVIAGSTFCPFAITAKENHILTMQCHPEFTPDFLIQLVERLREKAGDKVVDNAIRSIKEHGGGDRDYVIASMFAFVEHQTLEQ
ncbi:glutamine amidotransferase [Enterovibrio sp. FF113]|uniref:glutamine amidotransferase-related protein n=1 Tax=Enterovibrio sp. FF113 TaxID=3230010 RepID=UPI00352DE99E